MATIDFITELFCRADDILTDVPKHSQAVLYPSKAVMGAVLFALKGVSNQAFYRWLGRDYRALFPKLPERTWLFRLFKSRRALTARFLAEPSLLGVIDTYGIELIHPIREGRSAAQVGRKGLSNHRWIVGGKLCLLLNHLGLVVGWACDTANVADNTFQPLAGQFEEQMMVFADTGLHVATGDPVNLSSCKETTPHFSLEKCGQKRGLIFERLLSSTLYINGSSAARDVWIPRNQMSSWARHKRFRLP